MKLRTYFLSSIFLFQYSMGSEIPSCPGQKFFGNGICDSLNARQNSDFILLNIYLHVPPVDSGKDYMHSKQIELTHELFTNHDLRSGSDSTQHLSEPSEANLAWSYNIIFMTKATALAIVQETQIEGLGVVQKIAGQVCPGGKIQGDAGVCDSLNSKPGNAYMLFDISLTRPSVGTESDSINMAHLRTWSTDLFTKYDLRRVSDSTQRLSVPSDSNLDWNYGNIYMTKNTALSLIQESYVSRIFYIPRPPETSIRGMGFSKARNFSRNANWFNIDGRKSVLLPSNSSVIQVQRIE